MKISVLLIKNKKPVIVIFLTIMFLLLIATFVLPSILKPVIEKNLSSALNRDVRIGTIHINPLVLSARIGNFSIQEKNTDDRFISFSELYIDLEVMSAIKRGLIVKTLLLDNLYVNVTRIDDSTYNFSDLIKPSKKKDSSETQFNYSINNIKLQNGFMKFTDTPENTTHEIKAITISVPFFSNFNYYTEVYFTPSFSAIVNGTPVELEGKTKPFDKSMETAIDLNIDKIDLARYLEYVPDNLNFSLNSAFLSTHGHFTYMLKNKKPFFDYSGNLTLDSINITDTHDSLILDLPSLNIDINSAEIVSSAINLKSIVLSNPRLNVTREKNGSLSLMNLFPEETTRISTVSKAQQDSSKMTLKLHSFNLLNGKIDMTDKFLQKQSVHRIDSLQIKINDLDLASGCLFSIGLRNHIRQKVSLNGTLGFTPLQVKGSLKLDSIEPAFFSPYFPPNLNVLVKKCIVAVNSDFDFKIAGTKNELITRNGNLIVNDLILLHKSTSDELLTMENLELRNFGFNLATNSLSIDSIISGNTGILLKRFSDGSVNLSTLVTIVSPSPIDTLKKTSTDTSVLSFSYFVKNMALKNCQLTFVDLAVANDDALVVDKINVSIKNLSNANKQKALFSFKAALKPEGTIGVSGSCSIDPLISDVTIDLKNISLKPAQAYIAEKLNIALTGGTIDMKGKITYSQPEGSTAHMGYNGNLKITNFSTINRENADDFLLWKYLSFNQIAFALEPFSVTVDEIAVSELYSLFNIYPDGSTNIEHVLKQDSIATHDSTKVTTTSQDSSAILNESHKITIKTVTFDNCNINFSDFRFKNVFFANMKNLSGTISGLSSDQDKTADVSIHGNYDATSPITISGAINPLAEKLYIDLGLNFKDIDITQMNPYSEKYLGYVIRKGKLSLDLRYLVKNGQLDSKNSIFLNQLTLGEEVQSPDATRLPIKFALALIRDQNGDINLDLPVTGNLDDPKFNIGKILLQVLGNIITKAVTSPFTALGSLFGNSEALSYAEFDFGSSDITGQTLEKIDLLSKGLTEKEGLIIEIQGFADMSNDREFLKKNVFDRKLKSIKLKDLLKRSDNTILLDTLSVRVDEYEKYLIKAYDKETFIKPKTKLGFSKELTVSEMEKLIIDNIQISETDLKFLASTRALKIREYLINTKKINASRVFLIESKNIVPAFREKIKDSRVEFKLKAG